MADDMLEPTCADSNKLTAQKPSSEFRDYKLGHKHGYEILLTSRKASREH